MNLRVLEGAARGLLLKKRVPISVGFTITHKCNFLCAYCDSPLHKEYEMTLDEIRGMIDAFAGMGAARLGITGGEPLLKKELPAVVDHAHERGLAVSVLTNGSLVPEILDTLAKFDHVILSLEGFEESHDALRGKGTWRKAHAGLQAALDRGIPLWVECVLTRDSRPKVEYLLEEAKRGGFSLLVQPVFSYPLAASQERVDALAPEIEEIRSLLGWLADRKRAGDPVAGSQSYFDYLKGAYPRGVYPNCNAGHLFCSVSPGGDVAPCHFLIRERPWPNGLKLGFERAFELASDNTCNGCFCNTYMEINLAADFRVEAAMNLLRSSQAWSRDGS